MEGGQNLNIPSNLTSGYGSYRNNNTDDDEDLLDNEGQDKEIEKYIIQENLQYLDEEYDKQRSNHNKQHHLVDDDYGNEYNYNIEGRPSDEFEFDQFIMNANDPNYRYAGDSRSYDIMQNHQNQLDSERSNFTQESCSPPETQRDHQISQQEPASLQRRPGSGLPLNIDELASKLEIGKLRESSSLREDEKDELHQNSENFTLNMNQSPSDKNSLLYSFQGQMTSNFPQNLKDSSAYQLRDNNPINPYGQSQQQLYENNSSSNNTNKNNPSESDSNRFNGSFYKFDGPKIKDFEKSTLIKFEEFNGSDSQQMESDPNRKYSERISDRIYESMDHIKPVQTQEDQPFNPITNEEEAEEEDNYVSGGMGANFFFKEKNLPLFIITEEDHSEIHSSYNTFNRVQSINSLQQDRQQQTMGNVSDFRMNTESSNNLKFTKENSSLNPLYQKSKSQPIHPHRSHSQSKLRLSQVTYAEGSGDKLQRADTSPAADQIQQNSPQFNDMYQDQHHLHAQSSLLSGPGPFAFNQSRFSQESPLIHNNTDNDGLSQYFQRNPNAYNRSNITQPDFVISEEDLLSNVDRISKILPTNEMTEEEIENHELTNQGLTAMMQKLKDYKSVIQHLKYENQNKQTLIMIKESQMNLLQLKNEQLEEKIVELEDRLNNPESFRRKNTKEVEIQTQVEVEIFQERKKIRPKKKHVSQSGLKKTPSRPVQESEVMQFSNLSKQSSTGSNNVFDTPLVKNSQGMVGSPQTTIQHNQAQPRVSKRHSISFTSDDFNNFRQQLAMLKQQLQRSEENNLNLQQKIEKQKHDKNQKKERILQLTIEKNDLIKEMERLNQEQVLSERKIEGLKLDIKEFTKQIETLDALIQQKKHTIDQEIQAPEKGFPFKDQDVQTEFYILAHRKELTFQNPLEEKLKDSLDKQMEDFNNPNNSSNISTTSLLNNTPHHNNITIINNKQDLRFLLEKARNYEQISMQLQQEISDHRRILRDNQERQLRNNEDFREFKKKIKRREAKIDKLRVVNESLNKENFDLKVKVEEQANKIQDLRMKMESKLQEKEFKIISLKNQMKHFSMNGIASSASGFMTPVTSLNNYNPHRIPSQSELYSMINTIVQQQFQQQYGQRKSSQDKQRAKSHDQPYSNGIVSFYEDESPLQHLDEPRILSNQPNYRMKSNSKENPSFSQDDNQAFSVNQRDYAFSPPQHTYQHQYHKSQPSVNQSREINIYNQSNNNGYKSKFNQNQSSEIQKIFNSSLKRINQELESIKEFSLMGVSSGKSNSKNPSQGVRSNNISMQTTTTKLNNKSNIIVKNNIQNQVYQYRPSSNKRHSEEETKRFMHQTFEDSLQTYPAPDQMRNQYNENEEATNSFSNQRDNPRYLDSLENFYDANQNSFSRKPNSMQNTHTFRQTQQLNHFSPLRNQQSISKYQYEIGEQQIFNNTMQNNQEREHNTSVFYDFKPAFENSGFSNTSGLNNTLTQIKNLKEQQPQIPKSTKFESKIQSLENSVKNVNSINQTGVGYGSSFVQHVKLSSNLMTKERTEEDEQISEDTQTQNIPSEEPSSFISNHRRKYKSIGDSQRDKNSRQPAFSIQNFTPNKFNLPMQRPDTSIRTRENKDLALDVANQQREQLIQRHQQLQSQFQSSGSIEQSKSSLSNYSHRLEDIRKKYGRIN